ncbi:hydrolase, partial [Streptomyces niveus]
MDGSKPGWTHLAGSTGLLELIGRGRRDVVFSELDKLLGEAAGGKPTLEKDAEPEQRDTGDKGGKGGKATDDEG